MACVLMCQAASAEVCIFLQHSEITSIWLVRKITGQWE